MCSNLAAFKIDQNPIFLYKMQVTVNDLLNSSPCLNFISRYEISVGFKALLGCYIQLLFHRL